MRTCPGTGWPQPTVVTPFVRPVSPSPSSRLAAAGRLFPKKAEEPMKQILLRRWLGVAALGSAIVLGCSHAEKQCTDCMMGGTAEPPIVSSTEFEGEIITPVVHTSSEPPLADKRVEVRELETPR